MKAPFDQEAVRDRIRAILEGPGMTVFTKRLKADLLANDMTSLDAVNVLLGGVIAPAGGAYRAATRLMAVGFSLRGERELVIESAERLVR